MSPRPGGESDKLGNQYESAWTIYHVLEVLYGRAASITVEALGDPGKSIEFIVERATGTEVHQVKRQRGRSNEWSHVDLNGEKIFTAAKVHVAAGREYHFVSTVPCPSVKEVAGRARRSSDLQSFVDDFKPGDTLLGVFDYVKNKLGTAEDAWSTLRWFSVHCIDDHFIAQQNALFASVIFKGGKPVAATLALRGLVEDNLAVRLDREAIVALFPKYDLELADPEAVRQRFQVALPEILTRWRSSVERELIDPHIERDQVADIVTQLQEGSGTFFVVGDGGSGKSAVLYDVVQALVGEGWPAVAFRIDRERPFSSSFELGQRHGLSTSPVSALGTLAGDRPPLLVIDQLDAVSLASGRMPETFDAVAEMIQEAGAFAGMRVLVACRKFDLENDPRILTLLKGPTVQRIDLQPLKDEQVTAAVAAMGIASESLTAKQVDLLRSPFALKLLSGMADQPGAASFTSLQGLQEAFWSHKTRTCNARKGTTVRFSAVVARLATEMSERQRLSLPWSCLDEGDLTADGEILVSEHVLVKHDHEVSFFHESFFDYAFARQWAVGRQSLAAFLAQGEQELFRRSQVRQILVHLRQEDPWRFCVELEGLLTSDAVRFHLKQVAIAVVRGIEAPTTDEWHLVQRVIAAEPTLAEHLWLALRTRPWFERIDSDGDIASWLTAPDEDTQNRALEVALGAIKELPDRMAEILAPHAGVAADYPRWLAWVARFADLHKSRPLFDLVLAAVGRGDFAGAENGLFMSVYGLAKHEPVWAVELLRAFLDEQPGAIPDDADQPIPALELREHAAIEMISEAAASVPREFIDQLLPYVVKVLQHDQGSTTSSLRFRSFTRQGGHHLNVEDALIAGTRNALRTVMVGAETVPVLLTELAAVQHSTAQWLVYEGLAATMQTQVAEYATSLLLDRPDGFFAAHDTGAVRGLVETISQLVSRETMARLEGASLELRPSWETRHPGHSTYAILSAIGEDRLTSLGKRKLGELQRKFGEPPRGIEFSSSWVESPIPPAAAERMNDANWLRAMRRHDGTRPRSPGDMTGDASDLANVLNEATKGDPARFARLALEMDASYNPVYAAGVLRGLGDAGNVIEPDLVFEVMTKLGAFGHAEIDRWLGWAVRHYVKADVPDVVIDLLLDRTLNSPDPEEDYWSEQGSDESAEQRDPLNQGINCVRGHSAEILGDILVYDTDGRRTARVAPSLEKLAAEPSVAVKSCSAHLLAACLRHAEAEVMAVAPRFFEADDRLLVSRFPEQLHAYIGYRDMALTESLVARMLESANAVVRRGGGRMSAFVGLEHGRVDMLNAAVGHVDPEVRRGVAEVAAVRLPRTSRPDDTRSALEGLFSDEDEAVRNAAAEVAMHLRGLALLPFSDTLTSLIASPAFRASVPQLFITLQYAPDRIHALIVQAAKRYLQDFGAEARDMRTAASGDAHYVGELAMRAYAQARNTTETRESLDLIDGLLEVGAYGIAELISDAERSR